MHAYLSRDGIVPARFRDLCRKEVLKYPNVRFAAMEVQAASRVGTGFGVSLGRMAEGKRPVSHVRPVTARKLLIATGVYDLLPPLPGIQPLYGRSVFQCPYCDGWEMRGKRIVVYGRRQRGLQMARAMTAWTDDIVLCTDGRCGYSHEERQHLLRNGITIDERRIAELRGRRGKLVAVVFQDGVTLARDALFFDTPSRAQSKLAESLGCKFGRNGGVLCGDYEATSVPGVFVAGNIIRDVQLSIVAAAEGTRAAFGINRALTREDFDRRSGARRA